MRERADEQPSPGPFDRGPVPAELRAVAADRQWPDDLLDRMWALHRSRGQIERWLKDEGVDVAALARDVTTAERLTFGTLRRRHAQESDNDAVSDLFANAPEEIDGWEITVERSPDAFAQFRLQDQVDIRFIEDRGLGVAIYAIGIRNCLVGGRRMNVMYIQAMRVRRGFRGSGLSRLLEIRAATSDRYIQSPWPQDFRAAMPFVHGQAGFVRARNYEMFSWINANLPGGLAAEQLDRPVLGLRVEVDQLPAAGTGDDLAGVRPATRDDLPEIAGLVNRTHEGLDLFRPYTAEWLAARLDGWAWGGKPDSWDPVYSLKDVSVLESGGRILACAGLWDRGRHVRERWRHLDSGEERVVEATALLDFGHAEGAEGALADLIRWCVGRTHELGRHHLLASLESLPLVRERLSDLGPKPDVRGLTWLGRGSLTRPFVDLDFW